MTGVRAAVGLALAALLALGAAACAPSTTPTAPPQTPGPTPAGPPETLPPPATGTAEPATDTLASEAASPGGPSPGAASPDAGATIRDDTLLALLPTDIDGNPVTVEEQSFTEATADPAFTENVERAAFFIVTRDTDLASGLVAVFRDGRWSDAAYQDWRETYNEGVCAQAGGVKTTAVTTIASRDVWITTCAGGIRVYHVHVEERNALVSVFSLGDGLFGERIVKGLRVTP